MGNSMTIISVIAVLLLVPATRKNIGLPICISGSIVVAFYKVLKISFARPRPEEIYHIIRQGGFSFPSGHSMNGIFCYGMMIFLIRRHCKDRTTANILTAVLSLLIVSIGFSRIYVGVHYPSDVIGGFSVIAKVRRGKPLQLFEGTSRERSLQSRSISFVARASTVLASML